LHWQSAVTAVIPYPQRRLELKRLARVMCAVAVDDRDRRVFAHAVALAART
jgi:hypothetical protein